MLAKAPAERFPSASAFVAQLREALRAEQQAARLVPLYEQLQAAARRQEWAEVLALGSRIQALDPAYRDVAKWMGRARGRLRRPPRQPPRGRPAWLSPMVGVAVFLVLGIGVAVAVALLNGLGLALWPFETSTPMPLVPRTSPTPAPTMTPTPAAPPDLVITDLKVDTSNPRQGIPLHVVATLCNRGATTAQNFHWAWRVCVHEGCLYTEAPGALTLQPGEAIVAQMEYLFQGWATYTTEAWVDSRTQTAESDETNNTRQLVIEVEPGLPELVISAINFDPDPPTQGQNATIKVKVHNQGAQPTGAFTVEWWASVNAPTPACQWTVSGGLEADARVELECTYAYPSWYSKITTRAVADVGDAVTESDETNNALDQDTPVR